MIMFKGLKPAKTGTSPLLQGFRDGFPIGAGYFAVSFGMGILSRKAGLSSLEGFFSSFFTRASAGEYGSYALMAAGTTFVEVIILCIVANLRYLLMGTALLQKLAPETPLWKKIALSFCITDEIFAISIGRKGHLPVSYTCAAMLIAGAMWGSGNALGIWLGNILPMSIVSALSVALFGMFIAVIVGPAKKDRMVMAVILASFALSSICTYIPFISEVSDGVRIVILTLLISTVAAIIKPVKEDEE